LATLRDGLTGPDTVVTTLRPLAAGEAVDVVGRLVAAAPGPRLRRLAGQAGGNPLYLHELVDALLREEGDGWRPASRSSWGPQMITAAAPDRVSPPRC